MTRSLFKSLYEAYKKSGWHDAGTGSLAENCYLNKGEICELKRYIRIGYPEDVLTLKAIVFNGKLMGNIEIKLAQNSGNLFLHRIDEIIDGLQEFRKVLKTIAPEEIS